MRDVAAEFRNLDSTAEFNRDVYVQFQLKILK